MRTDHAGTVGRDKGVFRCGRRSRIGFPLPPGLQKIKESRRGLTDQRIRVGVLVPERHGGGFVDQPDAVLRIDHQDALAQMLHDVLRQLRHVRQVKFLAANQRLALPQPVGDRPGEEGDDEQHDPKSPAVTYSLRGRGIGDADEYLLHQHRERRHGGDQQAVAVIGQHGQRQHRQDQEDRQPAFHAPGGVEDEADRDGIDAGVDERDDPQARPVQAARDDEQHRGREIGDAGRENSAGARRRQAPGRPGEDLHGEQRQRQPAADRD